MRPAAAKPKSFHGTTNLDSARVGRDACRIVDDAIAHLAGLFGAEVTVTFEIEGKRAMNRVFERSAAV